MKEPRRSEVIGSISLLRFPRIAAHLRDQEINPERRVLILQEALELCYLLPQHIWCVSYSTNDAESARICDSRCELGASGDIHACKHDGVIDPKEVGYCGAELLYMTMKSVRLYEKVRESRGSAYEETPWWVE